jgi:serine beta-lactamase-like protein LACTB, mitochondrial
MTTQRVRNTNFSAEFVQFALRLALCLVATASALFAQNSALSPEKRGRLESLVTRFQYASSVPGISVAVVLDAKPVWSEGFGVADMENFVSATPSTLYRLGSISKPITAVAAMQLWEQGKLDLDAPLQKYCPAFPQKQARITTRELLGHLGGIRHYHTPGIPDDPEVGNTKHFDNPIADGLKFFADDALLDPPGTNFHYSTHGYTVVGCVIEGASGEKFVNYVHEHIFVPADMNSTQADDRFAVVAHRTRFYSRDKSGTVANADFLDSSYKIPGGGLLSSADDLARFAVAMLSDTLVKPATRDLMWTPQHTTGGKVTSYGLGWGVGQNFGLRLISHGGGQQGTSTFLLLVPDRRAAVIVLANMDGVDVNHLADDLLRVLLDLDQKGP